MDKLKGLASKIGSSGQGGSATNAQGTNDPAAGGTTNAAGGQDYLDKGVGMASQRFGGKTLSREEEEKYSDYARTGYSKVSGGQEIPIGDKNPSQ